MNEPEYLQIEIMPTGPQWQRRVRFMMGAKGALQTHGQAYCSVQLAALLVRVLPGRVGMAVTVIDRTGAEPVRYGSLDERK